MISITTVRKGFKKKKRQDICSLQTHTKEILKVKTLTSNKHISEV